MTSLSSLATPNLGVALFGWLSHPPAPQRRRSLAEEAAEVREFASRLRRSDPSFAAELLAAADRHERAGRDE